MDTENYYRVQADEYGLFFGESVQVEVVNQVGWEGLVQIDVDSSI